MHDLDFSGGFRLSPQQRHVWEQGRGDGPPLHVAVELRIEGALGRDELRDACRRWVERHEILHTTFGSPPGMLIPVQLIAEEIDFEQAVDFDEVDLGSVSAEAVEERSRQLLDDLRSGAFDLERGPLLRLRWLRLGEDQHRLLVVLAGLCGDLVGLEQGLVRLVREVVSGRPAGSAAEDDEPLQYADAAEVLNELLESEETESGRAFWRRLELASALRVDLGLGRASESAPGELPQETPVELSEETATGLAEQARSLGKPLSLVYLSAWSELLRRLAGGTEVALAMVLPGRDYEGLDEALGVFARRLPLVLPSDGGANDLANAVSWIEAAVDELAEHQDFFDLRDLAGVEPESLVWPCGFEWREPPPTTGLAGWSIGRRVMGLDRCRLELLAGPGEQPRLVYDPGHLAADEAERVASWLAALLTAVARRPELPLAHHALVDEEFRRSWREWNTAADQPLAESTLDRWFSDRASEDPERPALVWRGETTTFGELDARAEMVADCLCEVGVGPEVRVGVLGRRSPELMAAILGILKAGGAYLPLDPDYPAEHLGFLLEDSGATVLLADPELESLLPPSSTLKTRLPLAVERDTDRPPAPRRETAPANLAYVLYTSGSTGRPKGVMVDHRGLANYLGWCLQRYGADQGQGAPVHSPIGFDLTVTSLFVPLLAGRPATLLDDVDGVVALGKSLQDSPGFSFVKLTPAHLELLDQSLVPGDFESATQRLIVGGEALYGEQLESWRQHAPETLVINEYGPTEAVVGCAVHSLPAGQVEAGPVPIGRPISNARLYLLDGAHNPVPDGLEGEIYIGGLGLARGYLGRPALTAERFLPDGEVQSAGARCYRTGDLARRRPDGALEYIGRNDHQLKIRGYRIEPGEVEAALLSRPEVREAIVVGRPDRSSTLRLVAYAVPSEPGGKLGNELLEALRQELPDHLVPSLVMSLPSLPLTTHGKVDRRSLPEPDWSGVAHASYRAPRSDTEEVLAAIWRQVLEQEQVGIDDNFFNLGGDSIRSVQVLAMASQRGFEMTLDTLYREPTIRRLAPVVSGGQEEVERLAGEPFSLLDHDERATFGPEIVDAFPLVRLQAGMLFHSQLAPDSAIYLDQHSWHLQAPFEESVLRLALEQVVSRHPMLRASFDLAHHSRPVQQIHRRIELPFEVHDLTELDDGATEEAIDAWLTQQRSQSFDWTQPPLFTFDCHRRSEERFQLTLRFHHAILDGWSAASLMTECFQRYLNLLETPSAPLEPALSVTFRDYAALEAWTLESPESEAFWRDELAEVEPSTLPRWIGEPIAGDGGAEVLHLDIDPQLSEALTALARQLALPIKSLLLAAHLVVMRILAGRSDVVTGVVSNGRPEVAGGESVLGLFLNTLPLSLRLGGGSWRQLVSEVFDWERRQLPYRRYPLADLQRAHGGEALFESVFNFMNFHVYQTAQLPEGVEVLGWRGYEEANFPLAANFSLDPEEGALRLGLNFRHGALHPRQVEAIAGYYRRALETLAEDSEASYLDCALLSAGERRQLIETWNGRVDDGVATTVHGLFEAQVRRTPDLPSLVFEGGELSYRELDRRSNHLAHQLRDLGVGPESRVAIVMDRSPSMVGGLFAVLKAGGAYVPLDPIHPPERLGFLLEDSGCSLVLAKAGVATLPSSVPTLDLAVAWEASVEGRDQPPADGAGPDNRIYIIYTSGSTGTPRGVEIDHAALARRVSAMADLFELGPGDRQLQFVSPGFDVFGEELFPPLLGGGALVLHPAPHELTPAAILQFCDRMAVSKLNLPASLWHRMVDALVAGEPLPHALRLMVTGAEAPALDKLHSWLEVVGRPIRMFNVYGPTEATILVTVWEAPTEVQAIDSLPKPPIGKAFPGASVLVLDSSLRLAPVGAVGELCLGGPALARGYRGRPRTTAERFVPDPFSAHPGGRLYKTGDLARAWTDGNLEFLGRTDSQVKIRGLRIELEEIETVLRGLEAVREAAVVVKKGENPRLVAYVVPQETSGSWTEMVAALRAALQETLPVYMVPSVFVELDALPINANSKVDRRALPEVSDSALESSLPYSPPQGALEEQMANLWASVLGVERVGRDDNFFELGGDSITSVQLVARANLEGIALSPKEIFDHQSVAALVAALESAPGNRSDTTEVLDLVEVEPLELVDDEQPEVQRLVATGDIEDMYPPSPVQMGMIFHSLYEPEGGMYVSQMRYLLEGVLDLKAFRRAWQRVLDRHPILRTGCLWQDLEEPVQMVYRRVDLPLEVRPYDEVASGPGGFGGFLDGLRRNGFDLAEAPLMRLDVLTVDDRLNHVVWTHHHLVLDGWSSGRLFAEFIAFYEAARSGTPEPELALPRPYRDYIAWIEKRGPLASEAFWQRNLAGILDPTPLRFGQRRGQVAEGGAPYDQLAVRLSRDDTTALTELARRHKLTVNTLVQGAWALLVWTTSGRDDLVFGTTVSTRPVTLAGVEDMVGLFINTLPMRASPNRSRTLGAWLKDLQAQHTEIREHSNVPLGQVLRWSEVPQGTPLFESILVFENYPVPEIPEEATGLVMRELEFRTRNNYPLSLVVGPLAQLSLKLLYECERFDRETIERILASLHTLLVGFISRLDRPLDELRGIVRQTFRADTDRQEKTSRKSIGRLKGIRRQALEVQSGKQLVETDASASTEPRG